MTMASSMNFVQSSSTFNVALFSLEGSVERTTRLLYSFLIIVVVETRWVVEFSVVITTAINDEFAKSASHDRH